MNKDECVDVMKRKVEEIEKTTHREKFDSDSAYKKNIVNVILSELDKAVKNENQ